MRISARSVALSLLAAALVTLPAASSHAQDWAKTRLNASPRHSEIVTLHHGSRDLKAFVVYPEVKNKATVVILIHEIFGLSDWAKEMADELAAAGYIVVAPDLLSGSGPNSAGSEAFPTPQTAMPAVSALPADQVTADLDAAADYGKALPSSNGKLAVAGFCWGGGKSFAFATHRRDLAAAFVFYGPGPADVSTITAPVYGFYAGNDARIGATLPATVEAMKAANKKFEPITYEGAGHGFMRAGEDPTAVPSANLTADAIEANKKARAEAFTRLTTLLKKVDTAPKHAGTAARARKHSRAHNARTPEAECHDMAAMHTAM